MQQPDNEDDIIGEYLFENKNIEGTKRIQKFYIREKEKERKRKKQKTQTVRRKTSGSAASKAKLPTKQLS